MLGLEPIVELFCKALAVNSSLKIDRAEKSYAPFIGCSEMSSHSPGQKKGPKTTNTKYINYAKGNKHPVDSHCTSWRYSIRFQKFKHKRKLKHNHVVVPLCPLRCLASNSRKGERLPGVDNDFQSSRWLVHPGRRMIMNAGAATTMNLAVAKPGRNLVHMWH